MTEPYWEVGGPQNFEELFNILIGWVPEDAVLYFEGGSPDAEIGDFLTTHAIPEVSHVAMGTIWPRPKGFHVPATPAVLAELARDHDAPCRTRTGRSFPRLPRQFSLARMARCFLSTTADERIHSGGKGQSLCR